MARQKPSIFNYNNMRSAFRDFFMQHLDFAIEYISLHYPFTEAEVIEYLPYLIKGSAFYSEVIPELGTIIAPTVGLSFNQNIHWTPGLKRSWKVGYEITTPDCRSESGGYYDAQTGQIVVWGNATPETLFDIIPLDTYKEQADNFYLHAIALDWEMTFDKGETEHVYGRFEAQEFIELYDMSPSLVLFNRSIWSNTLSHELTRDFITTIIQACADRKEQEISTVDKELEELGLSFDFDIDEPNSKPSNFNPNIPFSDELKFTMRKLGFIDEAELE